MSAKGIVEIHGKEYRTVAYRVGEFRSSDRWKDWRIETEVLNRSAKSVLVKATVRDDAGVIRATGHGEESRAASQINRTSALENAETSAVGRALGLLDASLMGSEVASAEEVSRAVTNQDTVTRVDRVLNHNAAVRDNLPSILAIKEFLAVDDYYAAYECYQEIDDSAKIAITLAPTKGGIFTTGEVKQIKSDAWSQARREFHGLSEEDAA